MVRLFWVFVFLLPFQSRLYKFLKPLSLSWIDPAWQLPAYFEPYADFFISDFLLIALLGCGIYQRKIKLQSLWEKEHKFLSLFLGVAVLSIMMSTYSSYVIPYWRWGHLVIAALSVYCMQAWLAPSIEKTFKTLATVVFLSGMLECAVALPQYFAQHQLGLKFLGEPTLVSQHSTPPNFNMPKRALTSLDYYWKNSSQPAVIFRGSGTFPHPNVLGGFLVFSILMTCFLYERLHLRRRILAVALILQIVTLFTSYSRAALFACMGALFVWFALHFLEQKKLAPVWKPLGLGLAVSMLLFFPQIFYRGGVISYNQHTQASDGMRISMQNLASLVIQDHPWFGVGFNNYLLAFSEYAKSSSVQPIHVHNIYLLIAVETGLVGLGFFLMFCIFVLYKGWQLRNLLEVRTLLAIFMAFLAIGTVDYYPVVLQQIRLIFFLTAGLLCTLRSSQHILKEDETSCEAKIPQEVYYS